MVMRTILRENAIPIDPADPPIEPGVTTRPAAVVAHAEAAAVLRLSRSAWYEIGPVWTG